MVGLRVSLIKVSDRIREGTTLSDSHRGVKGWPGEVAHGFFFFFSQVCYFCRWSLPRMALVVPVEKMYTELYSEWLTFFQCKLRFLACGLRTEVLKASKQNVRIVSLLTKQTFDPRSSSLGPGCLSPSQLEISWSDPALKPTLLAILEVVVVWGFLTRPISWLPLITNSHIFPFLIENNIPTYSFWCFMNRKTLRPERDIPQVCRIESIEEYIGIKQYCLLPERVGGETGVDEERKRRNQFLIYAIKNNVFQQSEKTKNLTQ